MEQHAKVFIKGKRNGYDTEQCGKTLTVGELIEFLQEFDEESPVYLNNDNGYTYGSITYEDITEENDEDEE